MADRLVVERLEFEGFVGIANSERTTAQPLAVDLDLIFDMSKALATDDVKQTVDYATVVHKIVAVAKQEQFSLIETMAERLAQIIHQEFAVTELDLWIRKLHPPLTIPVGSVGAHITRRPGRSGHHGDSAPSRWLLEHRLLLAPGRALDLACGHGRNAIYLAQEGFQVEAWDRDQDSLGILKTTAQGLGLSIGTRHVDLEQDPSLPIDRFDLIVVFNYLQRDLVPQIKKALARGGLVVYETFLIDNHQRFDHPHRKEFCLDHNELLTLFGGLRILAYREGPLDVNRGPFIASLIAQRSA
jgi:tellurite methyltransferase